MAEQFANVLGLPNTSLAQAAGATDTTIVVDVTATANGFPATGTFDIWFPDTQEAATVTGIAAQTWAVTRGQYGTVGASHQAGAAVVYLLSPTALATLAGTGGPPTGPAGGDLSGTYPNPGVAKIDGASVPAAGALTTGNVLQVSGASALTYAPVNVAGGANYITGAVPIGNGGTGQTTATAAFDALAPAAVQGDLLYYNGTHWVVLVPSTSGFVLQTGGAGANPSWVTSPGGPPTGAAGGDLSGTYPNPTVAKINGASVPAAGGLTTGNVLTVTGASTLAYQAPVTPATNYGLLAAFAQHIVGY